MNKQNTQHWQGVAAAILLLGSASLALATSDLIIQNFDANSSGSGNNWGTSVVTYDPAVGNGGGSLYFTCTFTNAAPVPPGWGNDTPLADYICLPGENPWWNTPTTIAVSTYKSLQFDIKWDNNSTLTIDQFNNITNWPVQFMTASWAAGSASYPGGTRGMEVGVAGLNAAGQGVILSTITIPPAASNGWVHITIPIDPAEANIDGVTGFWFHKWMQNSWSLGAVPITASFWIDNVMLEGSTPPLPPAFTNSLTKAVAGLNVFASTKNSNNPYDRQEAELRQTNGLAWVGHATSGNPVTYSFTIAGFPNDTTYNPEAYLFLIPNPNAVDSAPDWNEPNAAIAFVQQGPDRAIMNFQYKVNEDHQAAMFGGGTETRGSYTNAPGSWDGTTSPWLESGKLGSVTNPGTALGTWQVKFTSDTNVTLIAPNGNTSTCVIPAYNAHYFAEDTNGFVVLIGMQANNASAFNQAVIYSQFSVSGSGTPFSENFLTDAFLDTSNVWNTSMSGGPAGVKIAPAGAAYWLQWLLPDSGFGLQTAPTLTDPLGWTALSAGPTVPLIGERAQLVSTSELPTGKSAFFRLIKRQFSQLQVLLPGETNAPNTLTGKVGTPDPVSIGAGGLALVTVNAVDADWYPVSVTGDNIHFTSTDGSAYMPNDAALAAGTVQAYVQFNSTGSWTVTATDTTSTNIAAATSSPVTVDP